jgi:ATP synthase F0 subunit b/ATP synthase F1 delta subunit
MSTFIGQLIGFAVVAWLVWRYVMPPARQLVTARQQTLGNQLNESAEATRRLADAEDAHAKAVEEAKGKAQQVIEQARTDSQRSAEQLRAQADAEAERVKARGAQHVQLRHAQLVRQLRQDVGAQSVRRAGELVREHVSGRQAQSATVDRMLDDLDAMAPSEAAVVEDPAIRRLRSASREALRNVLDRFDEVAQGLDGHQVSSLSDDLAAVANLLIRQTSLTRHLADPAGDPSPKLNLLEEVLAGQIGDPALEVCKSAVSGRWSADSDLVDAIEHVSLLALLVRAEREGAVDQVEEQLFRFGRILDAQPRLTTRLSDYTAPAPGRVQLLNDVLEGSLGVNALTAQLLSQTVELLHARRVDEAVMELAELAVARRGEVVAHAVAAAELSDAQERRLTEVLTRIYGHPVSVVLQINSNLLGGLNVRVGDEVIDGTLSSRLAAASAQLPD